MIAHYSARCNRTMEEREASPIIHLKKLHNWIKDILIGMHTRKGDEVLDMACGKGGDIPKWYKAEVKLYVGVDIVESSLQQAKKRYQELIVKAPKQSMRHVCSSTSRPSVNNFCAKFICADCFVESMRVHVGALVPMGNSFDICSCQFALHYSWSSSGRARAALANVAALLKPGGHFIGTIPDSDVILTKLRKSSHGGEFGNSLYRIKFDKVQQAKALRFAEPYGLQYEFHLEDAVDHCPEWLVPFNELKNIAKQQGLDLVLRKNFHAFVKDHMQGKEFIDARGTMSHEEWECVSLYLVFVFRKRC